MAGLNRRSVVAAFVLPFLLMAMSGWSRANSIVVNTTDGDSDPAPLCTLPDAVAAHNVHSPVNGCGAGSATDKILFAVTGTILIDESLEITGGTLVIDGPGFGCSGAGPCGITIDGGGSVQLIVAEPGTVVSLENLTLNHGFALTTALNIGGGGAVFANGTDLKILDSLLVNNRAEGTTALVGGEGGAIFGGTTSTIEITNSTIANNTAVTGSPTSSLGGGIYLTNPTTGATKITNSTIVGNSADIGGGYGTANSGAIPALKGTILAKNMGGNCDGVNVATDAGFNISDDSTCGFVVAKGGVNNATAAQIALDPLGLKNNGGPTDTIALEEGSIAIDRIPVAMCTDQESPPVMLGTDQRLFGRPDPLNPAFCDSGAYEFGALAPIVLDSEKIQVATGTTTSSDKINMALTFTYNGDPDCDLGPDGDEDALRNGFAVGLVGGTCASLPDTGLFFLLDPFVVRTVNGQSYGTVFEINGSETISARLVRLPAEACGKWTLNLEVTGVNTALAGLKANPFALLINDLIDAEGCFDITNAIVGNQIPTSPPKVRRGVRR